MEHNPAQRARFNLGTPESTSSSVPVAYVINYTRRIMRKTVRTLKKLIFVFLDSYLDFIRGIRQRRKPHFSDELRLRLVSKGEGRCAYCDVALYIRGRKRNLSIDHMIPVVLGGTDDESNLQAVCKECNCLKDEHTDSEFRERIQRGRRVLEIPASQPTDRWLMQKIMDCTEIHEDLERRKTLRVRKRMFRVSGMVILLHLCVLVSSFGMLLYSHFYHDALYVVMRWLTVVNAAFAGLLLLRAYDKGVFRWNWRTKARTNSTLQR